MMKQGRAGQGCESLHTGADSAGGTCDGLPDHLERKKREHIAPLLHNPTVGELITRKII